MNKVFGSLLIAVLALGVCRTAFSSELDALAQMAAGRDLNAAYDNQFGAGAPVAVKMAPSVRPTATLEKSAPALASEPLVASAKEAVDNSKPKSSYMKGYDAVMDPFREMADGGGSSNPVIAFFGVFAYIAALPFGLLAGLVSAIFRL